MEETLFTLTYGLWHHLQEQSMQDSVDFGAFHVELFDGPLITHLVAVHYLITW